MEEKEMVEYLESEREVDSLMEDELLLWKSNHDFKSPHRLVSGELQEQISRVVNKHALVKPGKIL